MPALFLAGAALLVLSMRQDRQAVRTLGTEKIPPRYWVKGGVVTDVALAVLGLMLAAYRVLV